MTAGRFYALPLAALLAIGQSQAAPNLSLKEAIELAERYVAEKNIDNGHRYLQSVKWNENPQNTGNSCWSVTWAPDSRNMTLTDGQLVVWVCNDGAIRHQDSWA